MSDEGIGSLDRERLNHLLAAVHPGGPRPDDPAEAELWDGLEGFVEGYLETWAGRVLFDSVPPRYVVAEAVTVVSDRVGRRSLDGCSRNHALHWNWDNFLVRGRPAALAPRVSCVIATKQNKVGVRS